MRRLCVLAVVVGLAVCVRAEVSAGQVVIPAPKQEPARLVTVADLSRIRHAASLSVSPDGKRFAVFVTQGDPEANDYRTGWFAGDMEGGALTPLGYGGNIRYALRSTGLTVGDIEKRESRWSNDGEWIAYLLRRGDELQLWRSRVRTGAQEQVTRNVSDIRDFEWSQDDSLLYYTAGTSRTDLLKKEEERARRGYRYDHDLMTFADLLMPERRIPQERNVSTWVVSLADGRERLATEQERESFESLRRRGLGGKEAPRGFAENAVVPPVARSDGAAVWLARSKSASTHLRVMMQSSPAQAAVACEAQECLGRIERVWWSRNGKRIFFWRHEGINDLAENAIYSWTPSSGAVKTILRVDDELRSCTPSAGDRLICVRETKLQPSHMAAIDLSSGSVKLLADLNPEFRSIRLGRVERFEWVTPSLAWNEPGGALEGFYPKRAYGYVLYPPDFDPKRKYPVFIEPYFAQGFNASVGGEHALHVYAANGFVVLNTGFPSPTDVAARLGPDVNSVGYSEELDFPHLTMLMESTRRAFEAVAARGFVDRASVGIGGVSHGTFVPLHLMQHHDLIAAISISSPHWGPHDYYSGTAALERATLEAHGSFGYKEWRPKPEGAGREFWRKIDVADHVEEIEGPVLMHLAGAETYSLLRLIRHLRDAERPYDAYVFPKETHLKWQPAHLDHIMSRNLDWFRFWLQHIEDPDPLKEEQYTRWRKLRDLQCRNPRSLRDYCNVTGRSVPPAR